MTIRKSLAFFSALALIACDGETVREQTSSAKKTHHDMRTLYLINNTRATARLITIRTAKIYSSQLYTREIHLPSRGDQLFFLHTRVCLVVVSIDYEIDKSSKDDKDKITQISPVINLCQKGVFELKEKDRHKKVTAALTFRTA